ncbi:HNH endonuclease [Sporosarcina sp. FSL W7-1283]|uniref:HNH endonuclease n=1 Tax=Sporosarcina sp. FSL W7-1283 TaxID=2921560 RepID=UPI0030F6DCEE
MQTGVCRLLCQQGNQAPAETDATAPCVYARCQSIRHGTADTAGDGTEGDDQAEYGRSACTVGRVGDEVNQKPLRPCNQYGCSNLTRKRFCDSHSDSQTQQTRDYDRYGRDSKTKAFYNSTAWRKLRAMIKIRDNGLCQMCLVDKRIVIGTIVDHIIPIKVDWQLRLTENNLQLLCHSCHNKKTAEDEKRVKRV